MEKKISELTEKEKWECTSRWLNALYVAFVKEKEVEVPCEKCSEYPEKCGCNVPPQTNFKVIEQFTGDGTIISPLIN